jgi:hypothetical protein
VTSFNRRCPFCGHHGTVTDDRLSLSEHRFDQGNKYGNQVIKTVVYVCPNEDCREYTLVAALSNYEWNGRKYIDEDAKQHWQLIPAGAYKQFPDYVPAPVLADYREACLIRDLSPKASATLSRRCLQGMIRDFWKVVKARLVDEIDGIKGQVDPVTWTAIDAVRNIGNIGAHMEKDINLVIDVDPEEAALLIGLIETLITEWYVNRHERERRMARLVGVSQAKKDLKSS